MPSNMPCCCCLCYASAHVSQGQAHAAGKALPMLSSPCNGKALDTQQHRHCCLRHALTRSMLPHRGITTDACAMRRLGPCYPAPSCRSMQCALARLALSNSRHSRCCLRTALARPMPPDRASPLLECHAKIRPLLCSNEYGCHGFVPRNRQAHATVCSAACIAAVACHMLPIHRCCCCAWCHARTRLMDSSNGNCQASARPQRTNSCCCYYMHHAKSRTTPSRNMHCCCCLCHALARPATCVSTLQRALPFLHAPCIARAHAA